MSMSWECTEGPYGKYPNEDGYKEDLHKYEINQFGNKLYDKYNDDIPWDVNIYNYATTSNNENFFDIPINNEYMCNKLINNLCEIHNYSHIRLEKDTKIFVLYQYNTKRININDISHTLYWDMKTPWTEITIINNNDSMTFNYMKNESMVNRKVILDIHTGVDEDYKNHIIEFLRAYYVNILYLQHTI